MLYASAFAVSWKSAFLGLFQQPDASAHADTSLSIDIPKENSDCDEEREAFHLDDTEIALRLVKSRGLHEYKTPPHAYVLFPSQPVR
jgi:hypothetical protein